MPHRFPGIDPYIEGQHHWRDFHARFLTYCCDTLSKRLPDNYVAQIDEQFQLVEVPDQEKVIRPDVAVIHTGSSAEGPAPAGAAIAMLEPVTIPISMPAQRREVERWIEIRQWPEQSLVTVIEVLSPSNKGSGRPEYLKKRGAVLRQDVNLVELDLLLSGQRLPMLRPLPPGDFYAFVARADRRPDCDVYAWSVRRVLPPVPIPLRAPDADVVLDLAAVYAHALEEGRYGRILNYAEPLELPLDSLDRDWAEGLGRSN
jgi:hypothetical protein